MSGSAKSVERLPVFSFLAVLVCFMGCLLALLILIGARAQSKASDIASDATSAEEAAADETLKKKLSEVQTYLGRLQEVRVALTERLANDRSSLAHLEDHTRRLRDQVEQQRLSARQILQASKNAEQDRAGLRNEAERIDKLVADSAQMLKETKDQAAKKTSYSIIPYEGQFGTNRRPIYLECRADAVILQPEGIALRENDFEDSLGPNSPLATAMRAASEHVARDHPAGGAAEQAYPLLIVRASGIRAYYAARAMLSSWSDDFGYELVDDNWDLKFPPPDPKMAQVLESAVTVARRRMQFHASWQRSAGGGDGSFSGKPARGHRRGGSGGDGADEVGDHVADGGSGSGLGSDRGGGPDGVGYGGVGYGGGNDAYGPRGVPGQGPTRLTALNGGGPSGSGGTGSRVGGFRPGNSSSGTPGNPVAGGGSGSGGGTDGGGVGGAQSYSGGSSPGPNGGSPGYAGGGGTGGRHGSIPGGGGTPGQEGPKYPGGVIDPNNMAGPGGGGGGGGGTPGGAMPLGMTAVPEAGMTDYSSPRPKDLKSDKQSLAETRGKNWALPGASHGSVGVTRPLRIEVAADRIMMDSGDSRTGKHEIRCTGPTEEAVEQFVSTMWEQMRGWGIAGRGMYWRPVLNLHVLPGGQQRAAELKDLLSGSGLDVKVQP